MFKGDSVPQRSLTDDVFSYFSKLKKSQIEAIPLGKTHTPLPRQQMISQVVSDRLILSGLQLQMGDKLVQDLQFRTSISRHYYAMYHAARAIVFADLPGDDFERHSDLPRNLPDSFASKITRESELTAARLLRNEADYDLYPSQQLDWEADARNLAAVASDFCSACEDFALQNGHI